MASGAWFTFAATMTAAIWERVPSPEGGAYSPHSTGVACYSYPTPPTDNDVDAYGQVPSPVYVFVFDEDQPLPRQMCIVVNGAAYESIGDPSLYRSVAGQPGGMQQVRTADLPAPPVGVTV